MGFPHFSVDRLKIKKSCICLVSLFSLFPSHPSNFSVSCLVSQPVHPLILVSHASNPCLSPVSLFPLNHASFHPQPIMPLSCIFFLASLPSSPHVFLSALFLPILSLQSLSFHIQLSCVFHSLISGASLISSSLSHLCLCIFAAHHPHHPIHPLISIKIKSIVHLVVSCSLVSLASSLSCLSPKLS